MSQQGVEFMTCDLRCMCIYEYNKRYCRWKCMGIIIESDSTVKGWSHTHFLEISRPTCLKINHIENIKCQLKIKRK